MRKTKNVNRSTRRTRAAIRNALLLAMEQKPVSAITVQEIIDHANICRTTFYAHFCDINDLVTSVGDEIIDEVGARLQMIHYDRSNPDHYPTIHSVVQIFAENADTIRLLNSPNGDPMFNQRMQNKIYEIIRMLRENNDGPAFQEAPHRLYSNYVISGGISVLNYLLSEGKELDTEFAEKLLCKMAANGDKVFIQDLKKAQ